MVDVQSNWEREFKAKGGMEFGGHISIAYASTLCGDFRPEVQT